MPLTYQVEVSDGVRVSYPLQMDYLNKSDIYVYKGGHADYTQQLSYEWVNEWTIKLTKVASELPDGSRFYIRRVMPRTDLIHKFEDKSINAGGIDRQNYHALYLLQEYMDGFTQLNGVWAAQGNIDMAGFKVINSGEPKDNLDLLRVIDINKFADFTGIIPAYIEHVGDGVRKEFQAPNTNVTNVHMTNVFAGTKAFKPGLDYTLEGGVIKFKTYVPAAGEELYISVFNPVIYDVPPVGNTNDIIFMSTYVKDPMNRDQVNSAVSIINALMKDGRTIVFDGIYVWPDVSFKTGKHTVTFRGGGFKRLNNRGTEYPIWLEGEGCGFYEGFLDGGTQVIPVFGQQGVYVREGINTRITNNIFKNIGDAPVRYARSAGSGVGLTTSTLGLVIANNIFANCTQVTSNNTGAIGVNIVGNLFRKAAVKVTQRVHPDQNPIKAATLIQGNLFMEMGFLDGTGQACISGQGFENLSIKSNVFHQTSEATVFECYFNASTFDPQGRKIPNLNLEFVDNTCVCYTDYSPIRLWAEGDANGEAVDVTGSIFDLSRNKFDLKVKDAAPETERSGLIWVTATGDPAKSPRVCEQLYVNDNRVVGEVPRCLVTLGNPTVPRFKDGVLEVRRNTGKFRRALVTGIIAADTGCRVSITDNQFESLGVYESVTSNAPGQGVFDVSRNEVQLATRDNITGSFGAIMNNNLKINEQRYLDNKFFAPKGAGAQTCDYLLWLWVHESSLKPADAALYIGGNILDAKGNYAGTAPRPFYLNAATNGVKFDKLFAWSSWMTENDGRPADSANNLYRVQDFLIRNTNLNSDFYKVRYREAAINGKGMDGMLWQKLEEWSDGTVVMRGRDTKSYAAPWSGDGYLIEDIPVGIDINKVWTMFNATSAGAVTTGGLAPFVNRKAFRTRSANMGSMSTELVTAVYNYEVRYNKHEIEGQ